jgi:hypothetical protein
MRRLHSHQQSDLSRGLICVMSSACVLQAQPIVFDIVKFPQELTALGCLILDYQQQKQLEAEQERA